MQLWQAILLGVIYYLGNSYNFSFRFASYTPLCAGFLAAVVLGDLQTGSVVAASIGLVYIGSFLVGGSVPADSAMAAILGTAAAVVNGLSVEEALAVAVPLGLIGNIIHYSRMVFFSFFVRLSDKWVAEGKEDKLWLSNVAMPQAILFVLCVAPITIASYYGVEYIGKVAELLSGTFLSAISVMAGMLPALGIAFTLSIIFKGEARPFFFVGFLLVSIMGFSMVEACIAAIIMAVIYIRLKKGGAPKEEVQA